MAFDADLADELLRARDRDTARFFAGRQAEIDQFDAAVREAADSKQAVFRIFQGAPGCGKTSLADHLARVRTEGVFFVDLDNEDLASRDALAARLKEAAEESGSLGARVAATALRTVAATFRATPAGDALGDAVSGAATRNATIVLYLDEAQTVSEAEGPVLLGLHRRGLGVATVCLFTGLSHTTARIRNLEGLSRPASNATVYMGRMSDDECAESTRMMLDALRADGTRTERARAAGMAVELSFGWPQHLFCAQQALCRALVEAGGALANVDWATVRKRAQEDRYRYYEGRLDGTVLAHWPVLAARVAAKASEEQPTTQPALARLCIAEAERLGLDKDRLFKTPPEEFADLMVEKGLLSFTPERRYTVAIPSMAQWLDRTYGSRQA